MANGFIPYDILSQQFTQDLTPDGRFVDTWEVRYRSPSGTNGVVRIPADIYTAETVDAYIQNQLQHIEGVARLGSEPLFQPE